MPPAHIMKTMSPLLPFQSPRIGAVPGKKPRRKHTRTTKCVSELRALGSGRRAARTLDDSKVRRKKNEWRDYLQEVREADVTEQLRVSENSWMEHNKECRRVQPQQQLREKTLSVSAALRTPKMAPPRSPSAGSGCFGGERSDSLAAPCVEPPPRCRRRARRLRGSAPQPLLRRQAGGELVARARDFRAQGAHAEQSAAQRSNVPAPGCTHLNLWP